MTEMLPYPKAIEMEMPPIYVGGISVLIHEMRKKSIENENYTEEVGIALGLTYKNKMGATP